MKVEGITLKGKNRVREHGSEWLVMDRRESVQALSNRPGLWLVAVNDGYGRWVEATNDPDFKMEGLHD